MEQYIEPFVRVCESVFQSFLNFTISVGRPYLCDSSSTNDWDISGIIGLTGEARGAVVLSMKESLALNITSLLSGNSKSKVDEEVIDAVGELVNIIAGNAKKGLEETFRLVISLPTIVHGNNHTIAWPIEKTRIICIPCSIPKEGAEFCLSVAIETSKEI